MNNFFQRLSLGLVFLFAFIIIWLYPKNTFAIAISNTTFHRLSPDIGDLEVTLTPDGDNGDYYLNLVVRKVNEETGFWVIRNMGIPSSNDISGPFTINRFFSLSDVQDSAGLEYKIVLEPMFLADLPVVDLFIPITDLSDSIYNVGGFIIEEQTDLSNLPLSTPFPYENTTEVKGSKRQKVLREDIPDIEEGGNECGPVSVVRSLRWFHNRGVINLGDKTDRDLIEQFKGNSNWKKEYGVTFPGFLSGKLSLVSKLNIVNKFNALPEYQTGDYTKFGGKVIDKGDVPTFGFVKKEIDDDEDVEICVIWTDKKGGGHCMTVIGYDVTDGNQQITVQDDENQDTPNEKNIRRSTNYTNDNPPRLSNLPRPNKVVAVVSESLLINLVGLDAISEKDGIYLIWLTGTEVDNAGFRFWRATKDQYGGYTNITLLEETASNQNNSLTAIGIDGLSKLINAKGDSREGASYSYVDTCIKQGETYYYLLEDVNMSGKRTFHWDDIASATALQGTGCDYGKDWQLSLN